MSGQLDVLAALASGPKTNAELQEITCDHSGSIARHLAKLIADGRACRIDGRSGRGRRALYALQDRKP